MITRERQMLVIRTEKYELRTVYTCGSMAL
jgi:hypothetical protein